MSGEDVRAAIEKATPRQEDGAQLLGELYGFLGRFIAYPSEAAHVAHTLWIAHTHLMPAWESTPRLAFLSPEPASGKTRALEVSELLVMNPVEAVNVSAAYMFRKVDAPAGAPVILFDEIDTIFGPRAKEHEDIRGLLNAGHRRGAVAGRCVVKGKRVETEEIPAYCAVALAGLGDLPDTLLSRSVIVRMRRRAPSERIEPFRRRVLGPEGEALRNRLKAWAAQVLNIVKGAWPAMPEGIEDRDADVWEALLAVADAAGGEWPKRARVAAVALVSLSRESTPSLGVRLLADLQIVFEDADALATETILNRLCGRELYIGENGKENFLDEAPWAEIKKTREGWEPLNARGLAWRLRPYGVKSTTVRIGDRTPRGYRREDLADAWARYLPTPPRESATSATSATSDTGRGPALPFDGPESPEEATEIDRKARADGWQG